MTGEVEWPVLMMMAALAVFVGGVLWAVFNWVYRDNNLMRDRMDRLQERVAQTYVTLEAHKAIKDAIDERGDHLEASVDKLSAAVDRMAEKHDRSIGELVKALTARVGE